MKKKLALIALGGALSAALSVALPVTLAPYLPRPNGVLSTGVRLPYSPEKYPDPNVTWTYRSLGLIEESSIRGIGVLNSWHVTRVRAGWPLPMLEGGWYSEIHSQRGEAAAGTQHFVDLKTWWSKDFKKRWQLPTGLVWSGLGVAGNWVIWSAAIGAPFLPGAIKRSWRRKRGLCLRCGYPRGSEVEVCSECGTKHAAA